MLTKYSHIYPHSFFLDTEGDFWSLSQPPYGVLPAKRLEKNWNLYVTNGIVTFFLLVAYRPP